MIDTHAHLDFKQFKADREKVISQSFENGIERIINIGCNLKRSKSSIALSAKYKNIYASVGVHPHDAGEITKDALDKLKKMAKNSKVVAVGEMGLDYCNTGRPNLPSKKIQIKTFKAQFKMARELGLPVILHVREAHREMLMSLRGDKALLTCRQEYCEIATGSFAPPKVGVQDDKRIKGVVHCFSSSWKYAEQYLEMGLYISFTGIITYTDSYDGVIANTPLNRIILETDCPYLAPVPFRGKRCEPWHVKFIAEKIAEVKKIDVDEVIAQTTKNAIKLFGL